MENYLTHNLPIITVKTYYVEPLNCNLYQLYIDGKYEYTYLHKSDVDERIQMIIKTFIGELDNAD